MAIVALCAAMAGFCLSWFIRGSRASLEKATFVAELQSLNQQYQESAAELRDLKIQHTQLRQAHLEESTARSSAEAVANRIPEFEIKIAESLRALEISRSEVARLSRTEAETGQLLKSTQNQLRSSLAENDAAALKIENQAKNLSELGERRATLESEVSQIPGLERRLADLQQVGTTLSTELTELKETLGSMRAELVSERGALAQVREELKLTCRQRDDSYLVASKLTIEKTELASGLEAEKLLSQEKLQLLTDAKKELSDQFKALAGEILDEKTRKFTEQNQTNLNQLLDPLKTKLIEFQAKVDDVYVKDTTDRTALREQVKQLFALNSTLSQDAKNLAQALKGSSRAQGTWGELILERLLESSGLRKGEEYQVQAAHSREDGTRAQPDVVVRLPEDRNLVIDAKVSLLDYETHYSVDDEAERVAALQRHLNSVRNHIKSLSGRNYQSLYGLKSLDFVLMFIPVEPAFMIAVQHDRQLFTDAWDKNVLLVSPSTLLFVVRTVAHLWRQEAQSRNAQDIANRGAELYDKLCGFVTDLERLGERLRQAQDSYNDAHGKLTRNRGNVIRQAEMLKQLGVKPSKNLPGPLVEAASDDEKDAGLRSAATDAAQGGIDTAVDPPVELARLPDRPADFASQ